MGTSAKAAAELLRKNKRGRIPIVSAQGELVRARMHCLAACSADAVAPALLRPAWQHCMPRPGCSCSPAHLACLLLLLSAPATTAATTPPIPRPPRSAWRRARPLSRSAACRRRARPRWTPRGGCWWAPRPARARVTRSALRAWWRRAWMLSSSTHRRATQPSSCRWACAVRASAWFRCTLLDRQAMHLKQAASTSQAAGCRQLA